MKHLELIILGMACLIFFVCCTFVWLERRKPINRDGWICGAFICAIWIIIFSMSCITN